MASCPRLGRMSLAEAPYNDVTSNPSVGKTPPGKSGQALHLIRRHGKT